MAIGDDNDTVDDDWVHDSGSSCHLVNDPILLRDAQDCEEEGHLDDGETISLSQVGNLMLTVIKRGKHQTVTVTEVFVAKSLLKFLYEDR